MEKSGTHYNLSRAAGWLWWGLVIAVALLPRLFDLDVFYARDELTIWGWSDRFTQAVWDGDLRGTLTPSDYPGIPMFWAQTLFLTIKYSLPSLFPNTIIPTDALPDYQGPEFLAERRLVAGLFVGLLIILTAWLVQRLFDWRVALLSAIFLGLDPFSLSEARILRLQMLSSLFVCLTMLAYLWYLRDRRRWLLLLSGMMGGLAASSQTSSGFVVPYIWLLLLLDFFIGQPAHTDRPGAASGGRSAQWGARFKQVIGNGLLWALGAVGIFVLIWPAMWIDPLAAMQVILDVGVTVAAEQSIWNGPVFFWGQILQDDPGPFFYPVVLAFRTTPFTWLGIIGAGLAVVAWLRGSSSDSEAKVWGLPWPAIATLLIATQAVLITVEFSFVLSKVDRYLLTIFPTLNILSAIGLCWLLEWLIAHLPATVSRHRAWPAALLIILALQLSLTLPAHPYFFTYWNPLVGGGRAAMETLPIGAGEGIDQAMAFANSRPDATEATLICGASQPWCEGVFVGETRRSASYFDGDWVEADYATFYISQLQRQDYPPAVVDFFMQQEPLHKTELLGATYMWLYAIPEIDHFAGRANDLTGLGRLLGYNLSVTEEEPLSPGETLSATVWWINRGAGVDNLALRLLDQSGYEWGRTTVTPRPDYEIIPATQDAVIVGEAALPLPPEMPPGRYFIRLAVTAPMTTSTQDRLLGEFLPAESGNQLVVEPGPPLTDPAAVTMAHTVNEPLAPHITLLGYTPPAQVLTADQPTWLALYWQADEIPDDYEVVIRLLDDTGRAHLRWQGRPAAGQYPTPRWRPGEIVRDVWSLQVEPDTPTGRYRLAVSLQALDATDTAAPEPPPTIEIPNIEVWPQPLRYDVPDMQADLGVDFGDNLSLLGYDLYFDVEGAAGGQLAPHLYWQSRADLEAAYEVTLTLRAAGNEAVLKRWRLPLGRDEAKTQWKANEVVNTIYELAATVAPGSGYHLDITLHKQGQEHPLPIILADGSTTPFVRIENIQDKIVVRVNGG